MTSDTDSPDLTMERNPRFGTESWLVAAFLALFTVAVASAMPQISPLSAAVAPILSPSATVHFVDLAAQIRERGIATRAPPAGIA
jgi:hypothetical protein